MKIGMGMILGLVGGLLAVVSVFLAWVSIPGLGGISGISLASLAAAFGGAELSVYVYGTLAFGILGLILSLLGKKMTSILALIFGLLTILMPVIFLARISASGGGGFIGVGVYVGIFGGLLLLIGGFMGWREAKKAAMTPAVPMAPPTP